MMERERREKERQEVFKATLDSYRTAMENAFTLQEQTLELTRSLLEGSAETLRAQTKNNRAAFERLAEQSRQQQAAFQDLIRTSANAYAMLLQAPFSYYQEIVRTMTTPWLSPGDSSRTRTDSEPPLADYDSMSVHEVSEKLDDLTIEELRRIRDYEVRNKNRQTLVTSLDKQIEAKPF